MEERNETIEKAMGTVLMALMLYAFAKGDWYFVVGRAFIALLGWALSHRGD